MANGTVYIHFLEYEAEHDRGFQFVATDEKFNEDDDYGFILRLFVQKYGGNWDSYEELLDRYKSGSIRLYMLTSKELITVLTRHDDLRWIRAIPPIPVPQTEEVHEAAHS